MNLAEYESYLDEIQAAIRVKGDMITCTLGKPFSIALSDCATDAGLSRQMRQVLPRLLEAYSPIDYAARCIINCARPGVPYHNQHLYMEKFYAPHTLEYLSGVGRSEHAPLQFEDVTSSFKRRGTLTLERDREPGSGKAAPSVRVICTAPAYLDYARVASVEAVELIVVGDYLVVSFDPDTAWTVTRAPAPETAKTAPTLSRFALKHVLSQDEVARAVDDTRTMFEGLGFTCTVLD